MSARDSAQADEIAVPHDLLLTGSALGVASGVMPDTSWGRFGINLARRPGVVAERVGSFGPRTRLDRDGQIPSCPGQGRQAVQRSGVAANPLLKRSMQTYLAAAETVDGLFADAHLDWRDAERIRFVRDVVMEGVAPSNNPLISPLGWKAIIDTGGLSAVRGAAPFVRDMASPPRVPSMVRARCFHGGRDRRRHTGCGRLPQRRCSN